MAKRKKNTNDLYDELYGDVKDTGAKHTKTGEKKASSKIDPTPQSSETLVCSVCNKGKLERRSTRDQIKSGFGWIVLIFGILSLPMFCLGLCLIIAGILLIRNQSKTVLACNNCGAYVLTV